MNALPTTKRILERAAQEMGRETAVSRIWANLDDAQKDMRKVFKCIDDASIEVERLGDEQTSYHFRRIQDALETTAYLIRTMKKIVGDEQHQRLFPKGSE